MGDLKYCNYDKLDFECIDSFQKSHAGKDGP